MMMMMMVMVVVVVVLMAVACSSADSYAEPKPVHERRKFKQSVRPVTR